MADINHPLDLLPAFDWGPTSCSSWRPRSAAWPASRPASLAIATNLAGINNVLQLCKRAEARCVFFSSSEVYGPQLRPMDDSRSVPQPNNRYGLSKWLGEQLVEYEVRTSGLRAVTLRPCMIYDEDEDVGEHRSAMIRFAVQPGPRAGRSRCIAAARAAGCTSPTRCAAIEAAGRPRPVCEPSTSGIPTSCPWPIWPR